MPAATMSAHRATPSHAGLVAGTRAGRPISDRADLAQVQAPTLFLLMDCGSGNASPGAPAPTAPTPCCEPSASSDSPAVPSAPQKVTP